MVVHVYNPSSTIGTLRQEDDDFKRSLGSIVKLCVERGSKAEAGRRNKKSKILEYRNTDVLIATMFEPCNLNVRMTYRD